MTRYQRTETWVGSQVDDSFVLLHIDAGNYVALNPTATAIWDRLAAPQTAAEIVDGLAVEFVVERSVCEASVAKCLEQMVHMRLVAPV